jgi:hypothetical protein
MSWIEAIKKGMWDMLTALLLCITLNLEEIDLQAIGYISEEDEKSFIDIIFGQGASLQHWTVQSPYSLRIKLLGYGKRDIV